MDAMLDDESAVALNGQQTMHQVEAKRRRPLVRYTSGTRTIRRYERSRVSGKKNRPTHGYIEARCIVRHVYHVVQVKGG